MRNAHRVVMAGLVVALIALPAPGGTTSAQPVAENFDVLGHSDLGADSIYGDVWVHEDVAYVGTWVVPCEGAGVQIVDVSDLANPTPIGRLAERPSTSAEDVVVRSVTTPTFVGDLLAVGLQRCGFEDGLEQQQWGLGLWDVTDPTAPVELSFLPLVNQLGGVHELDVFQRGLDVYALVATPKTDWFEEERVGDLRIIDITDPSNPVVVADWGAREQGPSRGPFDGQGNSPSMFAHSVRASADGTKAFVSYWDLGVVTLDISDVTNPTLVGRTRFPAFAEGEAHSVAEYEAPERSFLLQNDEDTNAKSPVRVIFDGAFRGEAAESSGATALWLERGHRVSGRVVQARRQGCRSDDYPKGTDGRVVVVRTHLHFYDPGSHPEAQCGLRQQQRRATSAGAAAVVHDWISTATSPTSIFDFFEARIPVVLAEHSLARGMLREGRVTLEATEPSHGFLRVFDADTGEQVATFDAIDGVHELPAPEGVWSIHNTEVMGDRAYSSWYSNGIVALDLTPLHQDPPAAPVKVGQFLPEPEASTFSDVPVVWGVYVRDDGVIFASDMVTGLWIVRPTGPAAA